MIEIERLSKSFAGVPAIQDVSFAAREGEILGVLGPNGAGKTTTMRILCGYLPADDGQARVGGIDVADDSIAVRRRIGYLPENTPLYPEMRVDEYLLFRAGLKGIPRRERAARLTVVTRRCRIAEVLTQTIGTLSKGYRQRVGLADALVSDPPVLVLDEPTAGLDPNQVLEVRELIRELRGSHTVLLCSHILGEVEQTCDRVAIFRRGHVIAEDSTEGLRDRISSRPTASVEIEGSHRDAFLELVQSNLGVEPLDEEPLADGWLRLRLESERDPREQIFRLAADGGIVLRELTRRELSLEQIFHELTLGADEERISDADEAPREEDES